MLQAATLGQNSSRAQPPRRTNSRTCPGPTAPFTVAARASGLPASEGSRASATEVNISIPSLAPPSDLAGDAQRARDSASRYALRGGRGNVSHFPLDASITRGSHLAVDDMDHSGVTPNEAVASAAFFVGISHALKLVSRSQHTALGDALRLASIKLLSPLYRAFDDARQLLISKGAVAAEALPDPPDPPPNLPLPKPLMLPAWDSLVAGAPAPKDIIPEQKDLTRLVCKASHQWSADGMSAEGKRRAEHQRSQLVPEYDRNSPLSAMLAGGVGRFLSQSPMQFLAHTAGWGTPFHKDFWGTWVAYVSGTSMPGFFIPRGRAPVLCRCKGTLDITGHHLMNCTRQLGGLSAGHTEVAQAVALVARSSGSMYKDRPSQVPHHDNTEKMGDALCSLSRVNQASMLLDFTMAHVKDTRVYRKGHSCATTPPPDSISATLTKKTQLFGFKNKFSWKSHHLWDIPPPHNQKYLFLLLNI